tara:strand:+ start:818 stop:3064 length:2247 start_codon:yes stop_codon:yes gene_type:complete
MISNQKLFSIGDFDFRFQHLLVLGILLCSISISMLVRSGPLAYETELFEYDPFFNYRATEYIVNNGFQNYLEWYDDKSWHPFGRDISETSQVVLHITAASLYQIFNFGMSLHTFTIYFPLFIGGMTSIAVFAFVRVLGGTSAGLIASLMFAISVPIFIRGFAGWFKSEPLGIFFGILALYLFVSGIKSNKGKISFLKLVGAALLISLALSAWGGSIFFIIVILVFYFALPFFKNDGKFLFWAIPTFSISTILFLLMFERTSNFLIGYVGLAIIMPTIFVLVSEIIKKFSSESKKIRNCIIFLVSIITSSIGIFSAGYVGLPTFRYLNAINPLLFSSDPLTDSVQEHGVTSLNISFFFFSIFIIFALIGIWYIFSKKSNSIQMDMKAFALIVSIFAIYLSSAFTRLELFAAIGLLILGGIGISLFLKEVYKLKNSLTKYIFSISILCLFLIPVVLPIDSGWTSWSDYSPTIINGGASDKTLVSYDWIESMKWLKQNTPENSVIAAWWDYGYWITTLSDRTTLVDNATLIDWQIKKVAYALLSSPDNAWKIFHSDIETNVSSLYNPQFLTIFDTETPISPNCVTVTATESNLTGKPVNFCEQPLNGMDADYVLVYVTVEKIAAPGLDISLYQMIAGGDESKKNWFARISNQNVMDFVKTDGQTPTDYFFQKTTLGQLIPFEIVAYFDLQTSMIYEFYDDRFIPIYQKKVKLNDSENDPFYLVYASPGYYSDVPGQKNIILIYKINPNYQP